MRKLLIAAAIAPVLALITPAWPASAVPDPGTDPFFAAPANLADLAPGAVIRSRPVKTYVLPAVPMGATSTQILVRSTDAKDHPVVVSATFLVPPNHGTDRLLAYQPATDSLGAKCEPSYQLQTGVEKEAGLVKTALSRGLTVVVPDHQGPRHAFSAGRMAGHAVLDAARGAIATPAAGLDASHTKVAMVGYSGGAIATGWAAQLQPGYAPELDVVGVASGGTPADLEAAGAAMDGSASGGLFVGAALGMMREYPELRQLLNAKGLAYEQTAKNYCLAQLVAHAFQSVKQLSDSPDPLREPVAQEVLSINKMGSLAPTAPVMLWHSKFDELIPYRVAPVLRDQWCAQGTKVKLVTNYLSEHNLGAVEMVPDALPWLLDRYAGKPLTGTC